MRASTFYRFLPVSTLCTIYTIPVCALFKGRKSLFPPAAAAGFRPLPHQIQNSLKSSVYIAFSTFIYGPYTPFAISCPGFFETIRSVFKAALHRGKPPLFHCTQSVFHYPRGFHFARTMHALCRNISYNNTLCCE